MDSYAEGLSRVWCRVLEKSAVTDYCSLDSSTRVFVLTGSPDFSNLVTSALGQKNVLLTSNQISSHSAWD